MTFTWASGIGLGLGECAQILSMPVSCYHSLHTSKKSASFVIFLESEGMLNPNTISNCKCFNLTHSKNNSPYFYKQDVQPQTIHSELIFITLNLVHINQSRLINLICLI